MCRDGDGFRNPSQVDRSTWSPRATCRLYEKLRFSLPLFITYLQRPKCEVKEPNVMVDHTAHLDRESTICAVTIKQLTIELETTHIEFGITHDSNWVQVILTNIYLKSKLFFVSYRRLNIYKCSHWENRNFKQLVFLFLEKN